VLRFEVARVLGAGACVPSIEATVGNVSQDVTPGVGGGQSQASPRPVLPSRLKGVVVGVPEIGPGAMPAAEPAPADEGPSEISGHESGVQAGVEIEAAGRNGLPRFQTVWIRDGRTGD